jgi:hypothetical protein
LQEQGAEFAVEEFGIGRELAYSDARPVTREFLFKPDFRKPRGRHPFDGRNGIDAADCPSSNALRQMAV